jgi:hypothetical protein
MMRNVAVGALPFLQKKRQAHKMHGGLGFILMDSKADYQRDLINL